MEVLGPFHSFHTLPAMTYGWLWQFLVLLLLPLSLSSDSCPANSEAGPGLGIPTMFESRAPLRPAASRAAKGRPILILLLLPEAIRS